MANLDVIETNVVCRRCGKVYPKAKGFFPVNYGRLYRGTGYLPWCRECVDQVFNEYYEACADTKLAVRQTCRKLDLYWNESIFNAADGMNTHRTIMTTYLTKLNQAKFTNKSYDDSLISDGTLWALGNTTRQQEPVSLLSPDDLESAMPDPEVVAFWGPGYTPEMYAELEQRLSYWKSHPSMKDVTMDMGTEALLRQITMTEIDINRSRAEGKPVDKMVNSLNTLLGSAMLKPAQKKDDTDDSTLKTPFGVWIKRWEDYRPTPEIDPSLKDVDGIGRCVSSWFLGHLCKMLGIKNAYSRLYEEDIAKYRVERPEFEDEDDDAIVYDIFGDKKNDAENEE